MRHAVEILIQSLDRADQDNGRKLFGAEVPPALLYEAALTVMMRLVFMLSAEERKLLPLDDSLYAENYAVSTLYAQLDVTEEEVLERRFDAWSRLLAVFRAVHGGIQHQDLHSPAYGGSLFDPERYPFLEGRAALIPGLSPDPQEGAEAAAQADGKGQEQPLPVNNRTVLHLLYGFTPEEKREPATYEVLVGSLNHSRPAVRQLAHWHLVRLVPDGKTIPFNALAPDAELQRAQDQWRALVPAGKLPAPAKAAAKAP